MCVSAVEDTAVHLIRQHEIASFVLNQGLDYLAFSCSYLHSKYAKVHMIWFVAGYIRLLLQCYGVWFWSTQRLVFCVKLYWKLVLFIFFGIGTTIGRVALSVLDSLVARTD